MRNQPAARGEESGRQEAGRRSAAQAATQKRLAGAEQNPLRDDYLFSLPDRTRAECLRFESGPDGARFEGRHHGYEVLDPPATHTRTLQLDGGRQARLAGIEIGGVAQSPILSIWDATTGKELRRIDKIQNNNGRNLTYKAAVSADLRTAALPCPDGSSRAPRRRGQPGAGQPPAPPPPSGRG